MECLAAGCHAGLDGRGRGDTVAGGCRRRRVADDGDANVLRASLAYFCSSMVVMWAGRVQVGLWTELAGKLT